MDTLFVGIVLLCGAMYVYAIIKYIDDFKRKGKR